jgi:hypothetical protein
MIFLRRESGRGGASCGIPPILLIFLLILNSYTEKMIKDIKQAGSNQWSKLGSSSIYLEIEVVFFNLPWSWGCFPFCQKIRLAFFKKKRRDHTPFSKKIEVVFQFLKK